MEAGDPFTHQQLDEISQLVGMALPQDYRNFALQYGNAFVGGLVDASDDFPVLGFMSAEQVASGIKFDSEYRKNRVIPIADDELGNVWMLLDDGRVFYVNYYNTPRVKTEVAASFSDFVARIVPED